MFIFIFILHFDPFFSLVIDFCNLVFIWYIYRDLELKIYFNLLSIWSMWYQKNYFNIRLVSEKYKAKRWRENIVSPHPLALWITIVIRNVFFFFCILAPFFPFGYWYFFYLVFIWCVYRYLKLIIYFNLLFVRLLRYQKNISASGLYIKKKTQHRCMIYFLKKFS